MNPLSILNPLYYAVAWLLAQIHAGLGAVFGSDSGLSWVLAIVVLVVFMRLLLVPLFIKQMHATRKMSALAPQLQELRKKYKNDKQTLNEQTMRLYKENGVNPLGGCLPLLAQMPLFFALFNVLRGISEWTAAKGAPPYGLPAATVRSAQNANILGARISDKVLFTGTLHVPTEAKVIILITVAISVATTFLTVRQSTKRGMTPQMTPSDSPLASSQKYMSYIVPLFALSGLYWQFGLVLYWVTSNVWTLGQQFVLFRRYPMPTLAGGAGAGTAGGGAKPGEGGAGGKAAPPARGGASKGGGAPAANGSGMLRRLGRGRAEAEPPSPAPETKVVRQQRVHQPRSKRSGKR